MTPILIVNPSADREFAEFAAGALGLGQRTPDELEAALRVQYPGAVVRARELSAERTTVWYVYREGHWVPDEVPARAAGDAHSASRAAGEAQGAARE
jgi:hypothetical protein